MDTSDFYDTAMLALSALSLSIPMADTEQRKDHINAMNELRDFIRAADEERAANNSHEHDRAEWRAER